MHPTVIGTILLGLAASLLAAALLALLTPVGALGLVGWTIFFESLQLPIISAARNGRLDACTERFRRVLAGRRGDV